MEEKNQSPSCRKGLCGMIGGWVPALLIAVGLMLLGIFICNGFGRISENSRVVTVRGLSERVVMAN